MGKDSAICICINKSLYNVSACKSAIRQCKIFENKYLPGKKRYSIILKNVLTIRQLHSPSMLVRSCLKFHILAFSITQTKKFQMSQLGLEKEEEPAIKLPTFSESKRKL